MNGTSPRPEPGGVDGGLVEERAVDVAELVRYIEIGYQSFLFLVGTPANLSCLAKIAKSLRQTHNHVPHLPPASHSV